MPHDSWADHYDCAYKLTYGSEYENFTKKTLDVIRELASPPARIVDFGAGTGRLAIPLAKQGYRVTAVEASAEMCRVLRAKAEAGVEGRVVNPCSACHDAAPKPNLPVAICTQDICEFLPDGRFDFGVCVFTVLNYLTEEERLRQFAAVAARAIRADGQLLVSFVENMRPMQDLFKEPKTGQSPDGRCRIQRHITIRQGKGTPYKYREKSELTKDGQPPVHYTEQDPIRLRAWSRTEIIEAFEAAGFSKADDLSARFAGTGEIYLQFRRNALKVESSASKPKKARKIAKFSEQEHADQQKAVKGNDDYDLNGEFMGECREADGQAEIRRTKKLIKRLKRSRVCLYPGRTLVQQFGIADFTGCLHFLGDCDCLVFCETQEGKEFVRMHVPHQLGWVDARHTVRIVERIPERVDAFDLVHDATLFVETGIAWEPPEARPEPNRFWGHYSILALDIRGVRRKLHLLHLGIGHQAVWLHFLQPHGIRVARIISSPPGAIIANPPYQ